MPSTSRFGFMRDAVRNHPVITASWAATAGILLGTFVTVKVMMPEPRADKIGPAQAVAENTKPSKPVAETTGSAPASDAVASAADDCDRQAWPYRSKDCLEAQRGRNRPPRVVTTDRAASPAMATQIPPQSWAQPQAMPTGPATVPAPTPSASASATGSLGSAAAVSGTADAERKEAQPTDQKQAKQERPKRIAKKVKAKPALKSLPQAEPGDDANSDNDDRLAAADQEDNPRDDRASHVRTEQRHRVLDRKTARSYDVPSDDDDSERHIVVIRRDAGPFERLFGSFGGD